MARALKGEALERELQRLEEMGRYEREYAGLGPICGVDEAGRGPLAGPVAAGAVILPADVRILRLNDSKKLSPKVRDELFDEIKEKAIAWNVAVVSPARIDEINILQATYEAMREAIAGLSTVPGVLLNDAVSIPGISIRQVPIIKAGLLADIQVAGHLDNAQVLIRINHCLNLLLLLCRRLLKRNRGKAAV